MSDFGAIGVDPDITGHAPHPAERPATSEEDCGTLIEQARVGLDCLPGPVLIFSVFASGSPSTFQYANKAAEDLLGRINGELAALTPYDLIPEVQHACFEQDLLRILSTGRGRSSILLLDVAGKEVPVEARLRLVACADGGVVFCCCHPAVDRQGAQEALNKAVSTYRRLFDNAVQGGFQTTLEGRFVRVNQAMVDMLGYDSQADLILGIGNIEKQLYVTPQDRARYLDVLAETGHARRYETQFKRKDGVVIWVALNVRLLRGEEGEDTYIEGFCTDITEVKRAEKALRESEELHRVLLMSLGDIVCITDDVGRFTYVSPNAEAMFGMTPAAVMELAGVGALLGDELERACMHGGCGESLNVETSVRVNDVEKHLLVTVKDVDIAGGTRLFACRDITDRRVLQAEAQRSAQLASLGELAAGVAHEINGPINGIMLYAEILRDEAVDLGASADAPDRILRQGERVSAIVRKLLTFARKPAEAVCPVGVQGILDDALALARVGLVKDGVLLDVDIPDGLPLVVGREQEVQQVFMNLISNARDALNEKYGKGESGKRLSVSAFQAEHNGRPFVRVEFCDQGIGMADAVRERIFKPFFSTKSKQGGTGLGLTITLRVIAGLGGRLEIDSREGGPTCVAAEFAVWNDGRA